MKKRTLVLGLGLLVLLLVSATANAAHAGNAPGVVYTSTNSPFGNAVAVFDRAADGTLTERGTFATGGTGTGANVGSQGAVVLSEDGRELYVVNAGSNSISSGKYGESMRSASASLRIATALVCHRLLVTTSTSVSIATTFRRP